MSDVKTDPAANRRVLQALDEAIKKLEAVEKAKHEPIAIIGLSGRFPGAEDLDSYWQLLTSGRSAITLIPAERWDNTLYFDPQPDTEGKLYIQNGGFLTHIDQFDPHFFGLSPREAQNMDPQHRLLLEVGWEALERANLPPGRLQESPTGVFIGITASDYGHLLLKEADTRPLTAYFGGGNVLNAAAGRLSYLWGLQGPSMAIDTACSSSLVALHLACQSLRAQECTMALAGGVNLILSPDITTAIAQAKMLSPDGRCKTFAEEADGYGRAEGCGVVVLKRLSQAQADGDVIWAVIRSSAVNQDGPSSGFTVPNGPAQQALIRQALQQAKLKPEQIQYVEAHGTGTSLGDPIEVQALAAEYTTGRAAANPLLLGSVKTNIGHCEAAAGVAGLIKLVLSLHHEQLPPHLHAQNPSSRIPWSQWPLKLVTQPTPWPRQPHQPRLAGLSSFGMSGTNAHLIIGDVPAPAVPPPPAVDRTHHLLLLSAKSEPAVRQLAQSYAHFLAQNPHLAWANVAHTANTGRAQFPHRLAVVAPNTAEAQTLLEAAGQGHTPAGVLVGQAERKRKPKITFLFTGQGSNFEQFGAEIYHTAPVFREAINQCLTLLQTSNPAVYEGLKELLTAESAKDAKKEKEEKTEEVQVLPTDLPPHSPLPTPYSLLPQHLLQPALFILEYALAQLWLSWGIQPAYLLGHSVGEVAAACVAGVFSVEDGLKLVCARGALMGSLPAGGGMTAVWADVPTIQQTIAPYPALALAAHNAPQNNVIAGPLADLEKVEAIFNQAGIKTGRLTTSHAFHSPQMEPILAQFRQLAETISYHPPRWPLLANLTGRVAGPEIATANYWVEQIRQTVQFAPAVQTALAQKCDIFIELGPKSLLLNLISQAQEELTAESAKDTKKEKEAREEQQAQPAFGLRSLSLSKGEGQHSALSTSLLLPSIPTWPTLLRCLGQLALAGVELEWDTIEQPYPRQKVVLPTYPFERQRYWLPGRPQPRPTSHTAVTQALDKGDNQQLLQLLQTASWSAAEQQTAQKLLQQLIHHHQTERGNKPFLDWLYEINWRPQPPSVVLPPTFWHSPAAYQTSLQTAQNKLLEHPQAAAYSQLLEELEQLSLAWVWHAWQKMGWQPGQPLPPVAQLQTQWGIVSAHQTLFRHLYQMMTDNLTTQPEPPAAYTQRLLTTYPWAELEITMTSRCGEALAGVLRGQLDPLQLLFPAGELTNAGQLYQNAFGARLMNQLTADTFQTLVAQLPPGRPLRILEIGAGTGGTTAYLLPHCPAERTQYTFTDLSLLFTKQAQEKFSAYPFIQFKRLDIEKEPLAQGFTAGEFDLIIAANVLHATQNLRQTLQHTRQLLAPHGYLLLLEGSYPMRWVDLIFGLTEGWWRFQDTDLRPGHPLLTANQWQQLLQEVGFAHTTAHATPAGLLSKQTVVLGQNSPAPLLLSRQKWLIIPDQQGVAQAVSQQLQAAGQEVHIFPAGLPLGQVWAQFPEVGHLVYGRALDQTAPAWSPSAAQTIQPLLDLLQTAPAGALPHLWLVTQGAQASHTPAGLAQTPLIGFRRVLALEQPEWSARWVDLPEQEADLNGALLAMELLSQSPEPEVAWQATGRCVPRLGRLIPTPAAPTAITSQASYLVTGGLRGLGVLVANWLVEQGAKYLVLLGRRPAGAEIAPYLAQWQAAGVQVMTQAIDVADFSALSQLLTHLPPAFPPLRGVIHAAGALDDGLLTHQSWSRFEKIFQAKVNGAWHLHQLTEKMPLDFFVLFSTTVAIFGNVGQANHAAANTFLDALAHYRQGLGLPAQTINWGAWSEVGAAAERQVGQHLTVGVGTISPAAGIAALQTLLGQRLTQAVVVPLAWDKVPAGITTRPLVQELVEKAAASAPQPEKPSGRSWLAQLQAETQPKKRHALLTQLVQEQLAQVLGLAAGQFTNWQAGFFELGMDSLTAMEFKNKLQNQVGQPLSPTLAFDYPQVEVLVGYLASFFEDTPPVKEEPAAGLEELSEDELASLLDAELEDL